MQKTVRLEDGTRLEDMRRETLSSKHKAQKEAGGKLHVLQVSDSTTRKRNIFSKYYRRFLMSQHKDLVEKEMLEFTSLLQDRLESSWKVRELSP